MRGPETGLVQGLLDWGSITSSGLSCPWYLSAAPSSLCGFIFSSSSHVLARWQSIPQTWLPHIISGGENDLPLPRHPDKHLVFTGSDRVLVGPIPDPVSVVGGYPCWNEVSSKRRVAPESWRPNSSNIQKSQKMELGCRMAKKGSFLGPLSL